MPAVAGRVRFYFDESALGLGKALAAARDDVIYCGHALIPEIPLGTLDHLWMPRVAIRGLICFSRDKKIRTKPVELAAYRDHGLRAFWIAGKKDLTTWSYVGRMVNRWSDIERIVTDRPTGPWFMSIGEREISEIPVPRALTQDRLSEVH